MPSHPLFKTRTVRSVADYVRALDEITGERSLWYRGHPDGKWKLVPSLVRRRKKKGLKDEALVMTRFRQNAMSLLPTGSRIDGPWDWMLLGQHYGVPTRLLDWTENSLVGLYFATESMPRRAGCIWVLDPLLLNRSAPLTARDPIPTLGVGDDLDAYLPKEVEVANNELAPIAVFAMRMFPRLIAQSGVFTVVHRELTPIEDLRDGAFVGRIDVPASAKAGIRHELFRMGVTRLSLFPELESAARVARSFID